MKPIPDFLLLYQHDFFFYHYVCPPWPRHLLLILFRPQLREWSQSVDLCTESPRQQSQRHLPFLKRLLRPWAQSHFSTLLTSSWLRPKLHLAIFPGYHHPQWSSLTLPSSSSSLTSLTLSLCPQELSPKILNEVPKGTQIPNDRIEIWIKQSYSRTPGHFNHTCYGLRVQQILQFLNIFPEKSLHLFNLSL